MMQLRDAREIAASLTPLERDLFMGRCERWGSWMFTAGAHLCSLGLGRRDGGSIYFDTPLADEVRAALSR
ncbi:MAG: hypothetical protein M3Q08_01090 [Pseudomonadota bacterium]|nr:hypothetical protein [Pseudomonadota bacterium]